MLQQGLMEVWDGRRGKNEGRGRGRRGVGEGKGEEEMGGNALVL